ncbi:type II toxin-antitoxin system HipA family toxin [Tessaracoccus massiliensis]|uniref:type II toxin-antitoxin system HipA family toxin n=1 Tax=Tessaracoccus massiliensis TaxID=1522311 RepID=UPI0006932EB4|nr:type II toxin-antitoxin system HipA family toxin [Tessaracoccus massiliensis]
MSKELRAYLDGQPVGTFRNSNGSLSFSYDPEYVAGSIGRTPMSLSMPLNAPRHSNKVAHPYLEGLLPDNDAVRQRWAKQFGVSSHSAFALLRHLGRDAPGAVQLLPPGEDADDAAMRDGDIEWISDEQFEALLLDLADHAGTWGAGRHAGRWSLPGAQSKVALYRDDATGRWGIPRDSTPTTHIVKPALSWLPDHHINEALCQGAAANLGLPAATTELLEFGRVRAIVSVRYDRRRDEAGRLRRLHQEDLCQSLAVPPTHKYQSDGGPGVAAIADLFARLGIRDREVNARRFFDALVYNVLIAGTDAHAKNYSLLLAGDRAQLGPLYDLASAIDDDGRPYSMAMSIAGHWTTRSIGRTAWAACARRLGLGESHIDRVSEMADQLNDALNHAVASLPADARDRASRLAERISAHAKSLPRVS